MRTHKMIAELLIVRRLEDEVGEGRGLQDGGFEEGDGFELEDGDGDGDEDEDGLEDDGMDVGDEGETGIDGDEGFWLVAGAPS